MYPNRLFISGIGTNIGKTIAASILVEALKCDYWKPIQAGDADHSDSKKVLELISNNNSVIYPETHKLLMPASPHIAAAAEDINIEMASINFPTHKNQLIIEGAGGLLVPLNSNESWLDFILHHQLAVAIVCSDYLGAINHSLMTFEVLKMAKVNVKGIIFNSIAGDAAVEQTICSKSPWPVLFRFGQIPSLNKFAIKTIATSIEI